MIMEDLFHEGVGEGGCDHKPEYVRLTRGTWGTSSDESVASTPATTGRFMIPENNIKIKIIYIKNHCYNTH